MKATILIEKIIVDFPFLYMFVSFYYKNRVKKEITSVKILGKDRVLCVGGGPCPLTAIFINKYTKAHITIIDNDETAVKFGKRFIDRFNLQSSIDYILGEGELVELKGYSFIHIAAQINRREEIVSHVQNHSEPAATIILRGELRKEKLYSEFGWRAVVLKNFLFYPTTLLSKV